MPRLSLCLIARDEEAFLQGCLDSVKGVVDDIVLVDTGSGDRTKEIAAAAGARVFERPWDDDFSAPRNEAIRRAQGDWLLQLDADERLAPGAGKELLRAIREARFDVGLLPLHNASAIDAPAREVLAGRARIGNPMSLPRLIRNADQPRYGGIVHETVSEWFLSAPRRAALVDAPIVHLGAVATLREARGKDQRNLALLRRRCERAPEDVTALGYLAGELSAAGDLDGAWAVAEAGWAAAERQPSVRSVLRIAAHRARLAIERDDPQTALATLAAAERRQGRLFDFAYWRGRAWDVVSLREMEAGTRERAAVAAAAAYQEAISLHGLPAVEKLTSFGIPQLQVVRGHALLVAARVDEGHAAFQSALRADPGFTPARLGLAEVFLSRGRPLEALSSLEPLLVAGASSPDAWLLASLAARALGAHRDAALFLERAQERVAAGFVAPHRESVLRALSGSWRDPPAANIPKRP